MLVRLREQAQADLVEIWSFLAPVNIRAADDLVEMLEERTQNFDQFPSQGRFRDDILPGLRVMVVKNIFVFYRLNSDEVEVLRFFDGRRDLGDLF